jgi:iron complex outermembrane receptor protein
VINIITKSAGNTRGLYVEAAAGTELKGLGSIRYGGKVTDGLDFRVYGTAFKKDNTIFQDSMDAADDWQMAQGGFRLDWTPDKENTLALIANLYDGRPDPDGGNPVIAQGDNVLARWSRTVSENSDFQVQAYYDHTWRDFRNGFAENLTTLDVEGQHRLKVGARHELVYGLGFRSMDHDVTNLEAFAFRPAQKSLYLSNAFAQDEIEIVPEKLRIVVGLKVEHNTYTSFQYQPNVRIAFTPAQNQTLWAAVSRAVRNPARIDREFFLDLAPGVSFISGSDFQSEEVLAYEAGWRRPLGNKLSTSIAAFFNSYDNIRSVEPGPAPFGIPITFGNGVKGNSYGIELSVSGQINNWWNLRGGYTYFDKDLYLKPGSADQNKASAESNDANHQALIQSNMQLSRKFLFTTLVRYVGELPDPYVSGYLGLDLRLAWKVIEPIELSVVGQNLASDHHTEFIPSSPATKDIERSVYAKLVCRF